jgi:ribose transport system substrate-binding protein
MKRIIIVLLIAVIAVAAFAGGGTETKEGGWFVATLDSSDNPWRTQMRNGIQEVVDDYKARGLVEKYAMFSAQNDPTVQSQQLDQLVNQGVDLVVINPASPTALNPIIDKAVAKGVIIMGVDQTINHPKAYNYTNDQRLWARLHGEFVIKAMGGKGKLVRWDGIAGAPANEERAEVWDELLAANPGIEVVKHLNHDWNNAKAQQQCASILPAISEIDGILNMECMPGIYQALMDAGRPMPKGIVVDEGVQGVKIWYEHNQKYPDNPINGHVVENPPGVGGSGMVVGLLMLEGYKLKASEIRQPYNVLLYHPTLVITEDNLEEWYNKLKDRPDSEVLDSILTRDEALKQYFE